MSRPQDVDRARRLFAQVRAGKVIFFKAGNDAWDIIGPADKIVPGETVTVTKADGSTRDVVVLTVMSERTVEGFATRTATFHNTAPAPAAATTGSGRTWYPVRHKSADMIGGMLGASSGADLGYCHFCGLELDRNGVCDECG